jgi:chromate transporter
MAPIVIALMFATGWILSSGTPGWRHVLVTVAATVVVWRTRVHLLFLIGLGAVLGALGWV